MARPGLTTHPKFRRAQRLSGLSGPHLLGSLEYLWMIAYEAGNAIIGDAEDIESASQFDGERGKLFRALLECGLPGPEGTRGAGFIEQVSGNSSAYQIHDLFDHAPEYVQRRMKREQARCAAGKSISDLRSEAAKTRWTAVHNQKTTNGVQVHDANGGHLHTNGAHECNRESLASGEDANGATPNTQHPLPAPAPINKSSPSGDVLFDGEKSGEINSAETIYAAYPRHEGKRAAIMAISNALKSIRKRGVKDAAAFLMERTTAYAAARRRITEMDPSAAQFTPHPNTWFGQGRFDDDPNEWESKKMKGTNGTHRPDAYAGQPGAGKGRIIHAG